MKRIVVAGFVCFCAVILVVCGSSGVSGASTAARSGGTIKVMALGQFQATTFAFPDAADTVEANADAVNAAGGINGKKIVIITCNDQGSPAIAASCARTAVSNHVVAVIDTFEEHGVNVDPILSQARIPEIITQAQSAVDYSSPYSFPLGGGTNLPYLAIGKKFADDGCKRAAAIYDSSSATTLPALAAYKQGLVAGKGSLVAQVGVTNGSTDFTAPVAQIVSKGAKCLVVIVSPAESALIAQTAHQSDPSIVIGGLAAGFPPQELSTLGSAANGIVLANTSYIPTDTAVPAVHQALAVIKRYKPKTAVENLGLQSYGGATLLFNLLKSMTGPISAGTVFTALSHSTNLKSGIFQPYTNTGKPPLAPPFNRLYGTSALYWVVKSGVPVLTPPKFVSFASILAQSSGR